jgi:hypothetical protein
VIDQYGIRSIIALNGSTPDQSWYADELAVSEAKEVFRFEMPLSANDELSSKHLQELLSPSRKFPSPCHSLQEWSRSEWTCSRHLRLRDCFPAG